MTESTTISLGDTILSAVLQAIVDGRSTFLSLFFVSRIRHKRSFGEITERAGLQLGQPKYLLICLGLTLFGVVILHRWSL